MIFSNQSRISFEPKSKLYPEWKQKLQAIAETVTSLIYEANLRLMSHLLSLPLPAKMTAFGSHVLECGIFTPKRWKSALKTVSLFYWLSDSGLTMFFVGDAAGRIMEHASGRPKDHGDTDRYPEILLS